ncbi:MAG: ubiquitin carboxyl-terminal hydrolase [Alphaproteobacteria bacterium]|nr:MAG: ubiquitin carboxyl-terminal hydrolase [Alphaproteobacteria bacterium]
MVILTNEFVSKGFSGLYKIGENSYMNAVLQSLSHLLPLTIYLLTTESSKFENNKNFDITKSYIHLISELWRENVAVKPTSLKNHIANNDECYKSRSEQNAYVFLIDFIDILHESLLRKKIGIQSTEFSSSHFRKAQTEFLDNVNHHQSIITDLFYGQYLKKYTCRDCQQYTYYTYQPFKELNLVCGNFEKTSSVEQLIKVEFEKDHIHSNCAGCSENYEREHEVEIKIFKLPEILIVTFNRFNKFYGRNKYSVVPNETLDFSDFVFTNTDESVIYTLSSIVCHSESAGYYSIVHRG